MVGKLVVSWAESMAVIKAGYRAWSWAERMARTHSNLEPIPT